MRKIVILVILMFVPLPIFAQPSSYDWRNVDGVNYVTSVKDQESCQCCVHYAATAALETWLVRNSILSRDAADLSEQVLISCCNTYTGDCGTCASGGASTIKSSSYLYNYGIPLESCFQETHTDTPCGSACDKFQSQTYKILDYMNISTVTVANLKSAIYSYGPIISDMQAYPDFISFTGSGVYHTDGIGSPTGHTLLVIGYDDTGEYFIVKNSWGTTWGDSGFGKVGYDQVGDGKVNFGTASFYFTGAYADFKRTIFRP